MFELVRSFSHRGGRIRRSQTLMQNLQRVPLQVRIQVKVPYVLRVPKNKSTRFIIGQNNKIHRRAKITRGDDENESEDRKQTSRKRTSREQRQHGYARSLFSIAVNCLKNAIKNPPWASSGLPPPHFAPPPPTTQRRTRGSSATFCPRIPPCILDTRNSASSSSRHPRHSRRYRDYR